MDHPFAACWPLYGHGPLPSGALAMVSQADETAQLIETAAAAVEAAR
jgi:hypothetical protein